MVSQAHDFTFDSAIFDLFATWAAGATLTHVGPSAFKALPQFVEHMGMTVWLGATRVSGMTFA